MRVTHTRNNPIIEWVVGRITPVRAAHPLLFPRICTYLSHTLKSYKALSLKILSLFTS